MINVQIQKTEMERNGRDRRDKEIETVSRLSTHLRKEVLHRSLALSKDENIKKTAIQRDNGDRDRDRGT